MQNIPVEILLEIASHCETEDIKALSYTSWRHMATLSPLLEYVAFNPQPEGIVAHYIVNLVMGDRFMANMHLPALTKLEIYGTSMSPPALEISGSQWRYDGITYIVTAPVLSNLELLTTVTSVRPQVTVTNLLMTTGSTADIYDNGAIETLDAPSAKLRSDRGHNWQALRRAKVSVSAATYIKRVNPPHLELVEVVDSAAASKDDLSDLLLDPRFVIYKREPSRFVFIVPGSQTITGSKTFTGGRSNDA